MVTVVDAVVVVDLVILLLVLVLPLLLRPVEHHLEAFLFVMGVGAAAAAGVLGRPLITAALTHPLPITAAVLGAGMVFHWTRGHLGTLLVRLRLVLPMRVVVAGLVTVLALVSSVITVIIASLILVELVSALRFRQEDETRLVVVACMAIGLGAALTPVGEPLSTIATAKLGRDFWYLLRLLGPWVIPGILLLGAAVAALPLRYDGSTLTEVGPRQTSWSVVARAVRVYVFVMALVLLGEGFRPLIDRYVITLDARVLYWVNMVSAVLDNATLTAAEVSPRMTDGQVRAVLLGLLISGGMLVPSNIPNIVAANRLGIRSRSWARVGVPLGLALLVVYFLALFVQP
jgi:predicted cation transporter